MNNILHKTFGEVDLKDPFFQSLREDYPDFDNWFRKKQSQDAFVQYDSNNRITMWMSVMLPFIKNMARL